jgi:hypothetical protein
MNDFLDFFSNKDWFNRPDDFGFSLERIIFLLVCFIISVLLIIHIKKDIKAAKHTILSFWIFSVIIDLLKYIFYNSYCIKNNLPFDSFEFPLWTCSIYLFVVPLSLFAKNLTIKNACNAFICSLSMIGGIINFIFPTDSLFSFMGLHTFLYHFMLLITPIIMLTSGYYKPKFNHSIGAIIIFIMYAIPVYIFNSIFELDYMFIYNGSWFGPMAEFASMMPHRIIWTIVCVLGHILVTILMIFIESKIIKR